jgi:site-specific DNA recombinase
MGRRAGIYCRISDDRAGAGLGVARQQQDCRALAERRGWVVSSVYTDNDLSAYSGRRRPGYEALLDAVRAGEVDAVVAWHNDRLHRSPLELEAFITLVEATGAVVATVQGGDYDLTTANGRMNARIVGAVARHESEHKADRQRRKHLELAAEGKQAGGGWRPFGYEPDRVTVREAEAALIRDAVARVIAGETLRGICRDWMTRGVMTPTGKPWRQSVLARILMSPRIAGLRSHHGVVVAEAVWPAIITRAEHERVKRVLTDPARRTNRPARSHLLTGLTVCGVCGARLVARPRSDRTRCYCCVKGPGFHGCGKIRRLAEPVEALVIEAVIQAADNRAIAAVISEAEGGDEAAVELGELEARSTDLAGMFAAGEIDRGEWMTARAAVQARIADCRRRLAVDSRSAALAPFAGGHLRAAWPTLSFDRRRAVLAAVIEAVVVYPAVRGFNRFDPSKIGLHWRA